ncbi:hypothetical protein AALP_AA6G218300 [Arabis alpina]|uniref:Uncharacterized protein n=1 Tax=Arabis alpina TaxID=50452 RepID=A0A087GQV1_ARAAL|nr:hypothetical protein AALP_AA6G218300 [Arabis alpina]
MRQKPSPRSRMFHGSRNWGNSMLMSSIAKSNFTIYPSHRCNRR